MSINTILDESGQQQPDKGFVDPHEVGYLVPIRSIVLLAL